MAESNHSTSTESTRGWELPMQGLFGHDLTDSMVSSATAAIIVTVWIYWLYSRESQFPVVGRAWTFDFRAAMEEGNTKYPGKPFVIPFMDRTVILPATVLPTLKSLPDKYLSTNGNMSRRFAVEWTGSGWVSQEFNESLKLDLTRNLNNLIPMLEDEARFSVDCRFGEDYDWKSIDPMEEISHIIALTTGRIFVGLPLSRDSRWSGVMQEHTKAVMVFAFKLRFFPLWLRPLAGRLLFFIDLWKIHRTKREVGSLLGGLTKEKLSDEAGAPVYNEQLVEEPGSGRGRLLSWIIHRYRMSQGNEFNKKLLLRDHLTLSFAATGIPAVVLTHAVIDLAPRTELLARLREEIEREINQSEDGRLGAKALGRLSLTESFLKESMRFNPVGIIAWLRMTHQSITLPSGDVVPPDTLVAFCNPRFNRNIKTLPGADEFIPDRWIHSSTNLDANITGKPARNILLTSTGTDDLAFGYGLHACPGRFFASAELKLILAHLIVKYDFKLEDSMDGKRPDNKYMDFMIMPPSCKLLIRRRA